MYNETCIKNQKRGCLLQINETIVVKWGVIYEYNIMSNRGNFLMLRVHGKVLSL